jgi:hypothetical protein
MIICGQRSFSSAENQDSRAGYPDKNQCSKSQTNYHGCSPPAAVKHSQNERYAFSCSGTNQTESGMCGSVIAFVRLITGEAGETEASKGHLGYWSFWLSNAGQKSYNYRPILEQQT